MIEKDTADAIHYLSPVSNDNDLTRFPVPPFEYIVYR